MHSQKRLQAVDEHSAATGIANTRADVLYGSLWQAQANMILDFSVP
jgi:hypothetical protein